MFIAGYVVGLLTAVLMVVLKIVLDRELSNGKEAPLDWIAPKKTTRKRKPVSVSEQEQWRREQKEPPLDPL